MRGPGSWEGASWMRGEVPWSLALPCRPHTTGLHPKPAKSKHMRMVMGGYVTSDVRGI